MRVIYVVGFPKSGNTWVSRIVADALHASLDDGFQSPTPADLAASACLVLKSHSIRELTRDHSPNESVLYVVRDLRDVLVSAFFHHHRIDERLVVRSRERERSIDIYSWFLWRLVFLVNVTKLSISWVPLTKGDRLRSVLGTFMTLFWAKATLRNGVGSWSRHVLTGLRRWRATTLRYEDLLAGDAAAGLLETALAANDVNVRHERVVQALESNAFRRQKTQYVQSGDTARARFLRKGRCGDYQRFLGPLLSNLIVRRNRGAFRAAGYLL